MAASVSLRSSAPMLAARCAAFRCCTKPSMLLVKSMAFHTSPLRMEKMIKSNPSFDTKGDYILPHPIWTDEYVNSVEITHRPPQGIKDKLAHGVIQALRMTFDAVTGYNRSTLTDKKFLNRMIYLETIAAIPGVSAGLLRTLKSLRKMQRDHGWIHTLHEEAENERMHLLTAIHLGSPGVLFRSAVYIGQGGFLLFYLLAYAVSPTFCHRLVGYLEEEAVKTYTTCLEHIEKNHFWKDTPAPPIAITYWKLKPNATMYDLIMHIRADEAHHREVNHDLANLYPDEANPYLPGH